MHYFSLGESDLAYFTFAFFFLRLRMTIGNEGLLSVVNLSGHLEFPMFVSVYRTRSFPVKLTFVISGKSRPHVGLFLRSSLPLHTGSSRE